MNPTHRRDVVARLRPPVPRPDAYDLYWKFASRRQAAFERRLVGSPRPWSDDPILQSYKFCNVYRAADRVSQYLIENVAYARDAVDAADLAFQIVAFRTFSSIDTWEAVRRFLGRAPRIRDLSSGEFERALDFAKQLNRKLYTSAFILCANKAFGYEEKHRNHVALFVHMFVDNGFGHRITELPSLQTLVKHLEAFPLIGPFMAYQLAIDLNYTALFSFSENDYTQAGPGAIRGIRKAFVSLGDFTASDAIHWMVDQQDKEFARLKLPFAGLFGRPLHAIDCQGLFCELDKYCREAIPALTSNRSRIKAHFTPQATLPALFFPPKWRLTPGPPAANVAAVPPSDQLRLFETRG